MNGSRFWRSPDEARAVSAVARDYPKGEREGAIHYAERLAILSGLVRLEDAVFCAGESVADLKRGVLLRVVDGGLRGVV